MRTILKDVILSYPDLFKPSAKYGKYGAQFRFGDDAIKAQMDNATDAVGSETWGAKWPKIKKTLIENNKMARVKDNDDEDDPANTYKLKVNAKSIPHLLSKDAKPVSAEDDVLYAGAHVDAWLDISGFDHPTSGPILSVKLIAVQFRRHGRRLAGAPTITLDDFKPITDGADAEDL